MKVTKRQLILGIVRIIKNNRIQQHVYGGWNFNSGNYLFTIDTKKIHVSKFYCPSV